ncbi:hypothetical protein EIK77_005423 [Talaromyces pinophilus]|nr:hypothetical protein EIK77_005423 [Talaromyces pinophilus]
MTEDGTKERSANPITEEWPTDGDTHAADEPATADEDKNAVNEEANVPAEDDDKKIDKLIPVVPTADEWYGEKYAARFFLEDGTLLPSMSDAKPELRTRIQGSLLDPRLQIFVDGLEYPIHLEFRAMHTARLRVKTETFEGMTILELHLDFNAFISIGLIATQPDATIEAIRGRMISTLSTLHLYLHVCFKDENTAQGFVSGLQRYFDDPATNGLTEPPPRPRCVEYPWYPYRGNRSMAPLTQFGQFIKRDLLKQTIEGEQIMKIPASNHFYDVNEASIKLVYGAYLEHLISNMHLQRLSGMEHLIYIFSVPDSNVLLGAVKFQKLRESYTPSSMADAPAIVHDGTSCVVKVHHPGHNTWTSYDGISIPSVFQLPVAYDVLFLLTPSRKPQAGMANVLSLRNVPSKQWTCKVVFDMHMQTVKTQVKTINQLCEDFQRWHPILLNHNYASLDHVDVFEGLQVEIVQRAYEELLALRKWNPSQVEVFNLLRKVPGDGFAFIEGIFGCGKTLVQAMLAKLLSGLGKHVLIVAPTNAAIQAISKSIIDNAGDVEAVRVVFSESEKVKKFGQHDDSKDQAEAREVALFRLLQSMTSLRAERYDVASQHDLQTHVEKLVATMSANNETLPFSFLPDHERVPDLNADSGDEDDCAAPSYDAIQVYNQFKDTDFTAGPRKPGDELNEWEANKNLFAKALSTIRAKVISNTKVLLCTHQLASTDLVRKNFATSGSEGIVIIADEDGQSLEPMAWIPVVRLKQSDHVRAVLRFGDREHLPPLALSATSDLSEFGGQMNRSLFDRHMSYHEPAATLNVQYRMHPLLSQFPNSFTYKGRIVNGPGTADIPIDEIYEARLIEWAKQYMSKSYKPEADFARLLAVNVKEANVITDRNTKSRSNARYAEVLSELLEAIFSKEPYPKATMKIIPAYSAQKASYIEVIEKIQGRTHLPFASLPSIATIDSMQGHEADIVFVDWTNLYGSKLGFLKDNRRTNVALSRAHSSLVVFFSQGKSASDDSDNERRAKKRKRNTAPPEVLKHWDWMVQNSKDIHVPPKNSTASGINASEADAISALWNIDAETAGAWEHAATDSLSQVAQLGIDGENDGGLEW